MVKQIKASHILVKTEQEATRLMGEINSGAAFAELAAVFGADDGFVARGPSFSYS